MPFSCLFSIIIIMFVFSSLFFDLFKSYCNFILIVSQLQILNQQGNHPTMFLYVKRIFSLKNIFCCALIAISLYHISTIKRDITYTNDFFMLISMSACLVMLLVRAVKNIYMRFFVHALVLGGLCYLHPFYWSTLSLLSVLLLYWQNCFGPSCVLHCYKFVKRRRRC